MKLFDLDGPFQRYGTIIFDVLFVNLLWLLITFFSLGILTGPALTGTYAGIYSGVVTSEGYTFKQFFVRFRKRFLPSLAIGIINVLLVMLSIFNLYMILSGQFGGIWLLPLYLFVLIEVSFIANFAYPLLAHTDLRIKDVLKTSLFLSNKHLPTSVLATLVNGCVVIMIILVMFGYVQLFLFLFVAVGLAASLNSYLITKRILSKYDFFIGIEY